MEIYFFNTQCRPTSRYFLFLHYSADPHSLFVRVRNIRLFPFLEYDSSAADILSGRPERVSAKKGPPPSHCGLKFWLVTTLRATRSLRSLKQALRLTPPAKISPFGHRPPFQWAGSCTSAFLCRAFFKCTSLLLSLLGQTVRAQAHFKNFLRILRGRKCDAYVQGMLERTHIFRAPSPHARGSFMSPLPRLPCLWRLYLRGAEAGTHISQNVLHG